jgi:hypothetical protein
MLRSAPAFIVVACLSLFPHWGRGAEAIVPAVKPAAAGDSLIDRRLADHWRAAGVAPAPAADDAEFLRRITLDLTGRLPDDDERSLFAAASAERRRAELIERLLAGPEFPLHFARVVDDWLQRDKHGDDAFVEWLRTSLAARRSWDAMFTAMLVGPWDADAERPANRFLTKRAKNLDALTADGSRAFFGVDITCARCHDHPLVEDWKQQHYYGLASFFHRTQLSGSKEKESIGEKKDGELSFAVKGGTTQTARLMFLDGVLVSLDEAPTKSNGNDKPAKIEPASRRKLLVDAALREKKFLSRAAVNRVWAWFFGHGLVEPVDQMHSGNPASVPKLLDELADDFADNGYDLQRLVRQIVTSRAYGATYHSLKDGGIEPQRRRDAEKKSGEEETGKEEVSIDLFLAPRLRPLTPRQFSLSLVAALSADGLGGLQGAERAKRYRELEKTAVALCGELDPTVEGYQAGYREALYLTNHAAFQKLIGSATESPPPNSLVARLTTLADDEARVATAFVALLGRQPTPEESHAVLAAWKSAVAVSTPVRERVADLLWAIATSSEFRFNH